MPLLQPVPSVAGKCPVPPPAGWGTSHLSLVTKTTLCLLRYLTQRDAQCVSHSFAVCRIGLHTVSYMSQFDLPGGIAHCTRGVFEQNGPVQRRLYAVRCNRLLADRFFATLSEALEDVYAKIAQGRSDQGSSPCSTPLQSRARTSPGSPHIRRLQRGRGVGSLNRRLGRHACRST